jgi:hypothetical protein
MNKHSILAFLLILMFLITCSFDKTKEELAKDVSVEINEQQTIKSALHINLDSINYVVFSYGGADLTKEEVEECEIILFD